MLLDVSQVKGFSIIPTDKQDVGRWIYIHPSSTPIRLGWATSLLTHSHSPFTYR